MSSSSVVAPPNPTSSAPPAASSSSAPSPSDNSPTSKPLLFFVALGFGVVFTNLWIIVGVKYCFRYNQRSRQAMLQEQNGEPIDMNNMARPRRKREKKLMSMDEVNDRFPLTKYKIWRSGREQNGLPTAGGITAPPSRAASIREHNELKRVSTEAEHFEDTDNASRPSDEHAAKRPMSSLDASDSTAVRTNEHSSTSNEKSPPTHTPDHPDDRNVADTADGPPLAESPGAVDDADDPIQRAGVPAEYANKPGDSCAICIDTLEDDDDVRGLTCGHAFHAGCLDPWLTSRRACCPLCKADFYVPKPRNNDQAGAGAALPQPPEPAAGQGGVGGGTEYQVRFHHRLGFPTLMREYRPSRASPQSQPGPQQDATTTQNAETEHPPTSRLNRLRSHFPTPRVPFRRQQTLDVNGGSDQTTPGQLEAGTH